MTHSALRPDLRPAGRAPSRLGSGLAASVVVHLALIAFVFWWSGRPEPLRPPVYRVELVGQLGPRRVGVEKATETAAPAPEAAGAERVPEEKAAPKTKATKKTAAATPKATPSPAKSKKAGDKTAPKTAAKAAPRAGAGASGGKSGADVANIKTDGIDFPYPAYLNNITRQIALNWDPSKVSAALITEVRFSIRRDGSVMDIQVVKRSGDILYDADARGAVEAVGTSRSFGPLPQGWPSDVLVVYFTFDYSLRPK